ncbi:MAG: branched-chain amino acid ABC transporter permease [Bacillota bacterium]|nr:branched-chain amino acid ABC transporter permease [Bacillota bacterium]
MVKNLLASKRFRTFASTLVGVLIVYFVLVMLMQNGIIGDYQQTLIIGMGINIILAVGLNLIIGFTGQLSLGFAGFMSIGAYAATIVTTKWDLPFIVALLFGAVVSGLIGLIIGYPILRLKGDYLAICTLGFGQIVMVILQNIDSLGGARGLTGIPKLTDFNWIFFSAVICIIVVRNILTSSQGRAMISVREDEIASESMGINTTKYKILAFAIGSMLAGLAGGFYAHNYYTIAPKNFDFLKSLDILIFVVFGGMGSLSGSVIAAGVLTLLPEALRFMQNYRMVIYPILLIILMLFRPQGLFGTRELSGILKGAASKKKGGDKDVVARG